jgi:hypothetical protein
MPALDSPPYSNPQANVDAKPAGARRGTPLGVAAAIAAFFLMVILGGVIYVKTDYGDLVVELSDPTAHVDVLVNGQELTLDPDHRAIHIRAGANQKLEIRSADFETTSESFDLKRGGTTTVRVTLRPKSVLAPTAATTATEASATVPKAPPTPIPQPDHATIIELPGWQILADATRADIEQWLDDRRAANHSVMWLDAVHVTDRPVFAAVAALDGRQTDWVAFLDITADEINNFSLLAPRFNGQPHVIIALSGFASNNGFTTVGLFRRGGFTPTALGAAPLTVTNEVLEERRKRGYAAKMNRPFSMPKSESWCAAYMEAVPGQESVYVLNVTETELNRRLEQYRTSHTPLSVVPFPSEDGLRFAATFRANSTESTWELHRNLVVDEFRAKATELVERGFAPASVTISPWDGAVRYTSIWTKDPPKPVELKDY